MDTVKKTWILEGIKEPDGYIRTSSEFYDNPHFYAKISTKCVGPAWLCPYNHQMPQEIFDW